MPSCIKIKRTTPSNWQVIVIVLKKCIPICIITENNMSWSYVIQNTLKWIWIGGLGKPSSWLKNINMIFSNDGYLTFILWHSFQGSHVYRIACIIKTYVYIHILYSSELVICTYIFYILRNKGVANFSPLFTKSWVCTYDIKLYPTFLYLLILVNYIHK
jgi:hypothetical protein